MMDNNNQFKTGYVGFLLMLLLFQMITGIGFAQTTNLLVKHEEKVVLKFPEMKTDEDFNLVKNTLENFKGVNVTYRCISNQYIVLRIDKDLQPDNMPMINVLKEKKIQYGEIEGWDEELAKYSCSDNKN